MLPTLFRRLLTNDCFKKKYSLHWRYISVCYLQMNLVVIFPAIRFLSVCYLQMTMVVIFPVLEVRFNTLLTLAMVVISPAF